ncbi:MAG: ABC transporter [Candidatus Fischerbacteria bacterium RBG_13_37_8]|uniref:ABC transporter n=1 Tax=Candidatus Fischerbacteria bacterium RBG_13_37_8 TaxID=1817863 RepID=A0A1F5V7Y4_9BACT|nr:MAG: ABC transporter [Candidatus Fischerbacteria bacterium RBG_13_37_8]
MKNVYTLCCKEFRTYFVSPIAYIVISIFLIISGWFFFSTFFLYNQASMRNFFGLLPIIFAFIIPAVTMRLFSEEINIGSYEILMTLPVSYAEVILGKFLASLAFVVIMLLPTVAYAVTISFMGTLDIGPVIGAYIGAILLGGLFSAVGIFASSLTRNQIIAFIIGMAICFILTIIDKMLFFLPQSLLSFFEYIGADFHFRNISKGIIDSRDVLYFVSVSFIILYATHLVLQEKN